KHIQEVGAGTSQRASAAIAGPSASNQYRGLTTSVNDIINKLRSHPQFSPLVSGMSPESLGIAAGVLHNLGADSLERLAQGDTEILGHIQLSMAELEKKQVCFLQGLKVCKGVHKDVGFILRGISISSYGPQHYITQNIRLIFLGTSI
ncbi:unnamed protein product, partial [Owenia fusiformis]